MVQYKNYTAEMGIENTTEHKNTNNVGLKVTHNTVRARRHEIHSRLNEWLVWLYFYIFFFIHEDPIQGLHCFYKNFFIKLCIAFPF